MYSSIGSIFSLRLPNIRRKMMRVPKNIISILRKVWAITVGSNYNIHWLFFSNTYWVSELIMVSLPLFPWFLVVFILSSFFLFTHFVRLPVLLILWLLLLPVIEKVVEWLTPLLSSLLLLIHLSSNFFLLLLVEFVEEIFILSSKWIELSTILCAIVSVPTPFFSLRWFFIIVILMLLVLLLLTLLLLSIILLLLLTERTSILLPLITIEAPSFLLLLLRILRLLTVCAHTVILALSIFIAKDIVGGSDVLEFVGGLPLRFVRVILLSQLIVGRLDVFFTGWGRHS